MGNKNQPHSCRWATPTLFLEWPYWIDSMSWPWSCLLGKRLHLLSNGDRCRQCSHWSGRSAAEKPPGFDPDQPVLKD
jgi:hypothetical protein